jgi:DNA-binding MarR family transcriptional regulator
MIKIPEFEIRKGVVSDEMVSERMPQVIDEETFLVEDTDETPEPEQGYRIQQREDAPALGPTSMAFLTDVRDHPDSGVAARYKRLGLSVRQGQKLKDKLIERGLIQEHEEHTQTGRIKVVRLTEQGWQALSERGGL